MPVLECRFFRFIKKMICNNISCPSLLTKLIYKLPHRDGHDYGSFKRHLTWGESLLDILSEQSYRANFINQKKYFKTEKLGKFFLLRYN